MDTYYQPNYQPKYQPNCEPNYQPKNKVQILNSNEENQQQLIKEYFKDKSINPQELFALLEGTNTRNQILAGLWDNEDIQELQESGVETSKELAAILGSNPEIRVARILTRDNGKTTPILLIDSKQNDQTLLFNPELQTKEKRENAKTHVINNTEELLQVLCHQWNLELSNLDAIFHKQQDEIRVSIPEGNKPVLAKRGGNAIEPGEVVGEGQILAYISNTPVTSPVLGIVEAIASDRIEQGQFFQQGELIAQISGHNIQAPTTGLIWWNQASPIQFNTYIKAGDPIALVGEELITSPTSGQIVEIKEKNLYIKPELSTTQEMVQNLVRPNGKYSNIKALIKTEPEPEPEPEPVREIAKKKIKDIPTIKLF